MKNNFEVSLTPYGDNFWRGDDLSGMDSGMSTTKHFIEEYPHKNWTLTVFDSSTLEFIEIYCNVSEMPSVVSHVFNLEHAYPINIVGECLAAQSYLVGMNLTKGRLNIPGVYKFKNDRLIELE